MSNIFDLDSLQDFMNAFMQDGREIDGDLFYNYDEDHKRKVQELVNEDAMYLYLIQKKCGLDPFDDSYFGPDTDLKIVNVDHFAIKKEAKDKLDEIRAKIYSVIDDVYTNKDQADFSELDCD